MNREAFLANVAARLGRERRVVPGARTAAGVLERHERDPLAGGERDLARRFEIELARVGGTSERLRASELAAAIERFLAARGATSIASFDTAEFEGLGLERLLERAARPSALGARAFVAACERADAGLTTVDAAVAATGSIVLSAAVSRPRCTSLLPPVHVAIVRVEQIVARLGEAFERALARGPLPSQLFAITGPSRTSDIENDLSIGVHGPGVVHVLLVEGAP